MTKTEYIYNAIVIKVVDGDTIDVLLDLGFYVKYETRLRLARINTPEMNSPLEEERQKAQEAKQYMMMRIDGRPVVIDSRRKDKYGRFIAEVYFEGVNINDELLEKQLAVLYGS